MKNSVQFYQNHASTFKAKFVTEDKMLVIINLIQINANGFRFLNHMHSFGILKIHQSRPSIKCFRIIITEGVIQIPQVNQKLLY